MDTVRRETYPGLPETPEEGLTLVEKLKVLQDDKLAGFLPTTHQEKNQALELLSYRNLTKKNICFPQKKLQEIFQHQVKHYEPQFLQEYLHQGINEVKAEKLAQSNAWDEGKKAAKSVVFEWGDYLLQATKQTESLLDLKTVVDNCYNPNIYLLDETSRDHPGIAPLIRYIDLTQISEGKSILFPEKDPLKTVISPYVEIEGDKNKTIQDSYTASVTSKEIDDYILHCTQDLTIGQLRQVIKDAVYDQEKRKDFWENRIQESQKYLAVKDVVKTILNQTTQLVQ